MNLLIVDHHFGQDIEALSRVATSHRIRVLDANMFGRVAQRHFPPWVFMSILGEAYALPEFAEARARHLEDVRTLLRDIYATFRFDVLVLPSDSIPAFRPCAAVLHDMGLPLVVLQKETAISPFTMEEESRTIAATIPFSGDLMLTCSENNRQYWLNAGADSAKIVVTGQPRFDFYHYPANWKTLRDLGIRIDTARSTVLFLSYDLGAYCPVGVLTSTWQQLRGETESVLIDLARHASFNLLIKPHPQQQNLEADRQRLCDLAGDTWERTVHLLPPQTDFRHLVVNVRTVVGFQSTAMFEAMAAGKQVIYTWWTAATRQYVPALIPFHEMGEALHIVTSPEELKRCVLAGPSALGSEQMQRRAREAQHQLGPLDGKAGERSLAELERFVARYGSADRNRERRRQLDGGVWRRRVKVLARSGVGLIVWAGAIVGLPVLYAAWRIARPLCGRARPMSPMRDYRIRCLQGCHEALDNLRLGFQSLPGDHA